MQKNKILYEQPKESFISYESQENDFFAIIRFNVRDEIKK
jgi:hypothetical protein